MKTNELMVGDWVKMPFGLPEIRQIKYPSEIDDADFYEPIPLTLEILQKNGFKTDGEAIWASFCPEDNEFALEISEPNYYDENYGERGYWWTINACEYSIIPLRYVHELQHALKLCGIDKEIKL